ncbi:uncharacterized protein LOC121875522 [Homarus americanus]|uniref:uncharacterized protein LOC121875522 n=1 Tax=Homarus americanus TaxID=6706 RepID=UPI001C46677A|nr:uncharacterized protein LOC121875522 [Homarus americanus]
MYRREMPVGEPVQGLLLQQHEYNVFIVFPAESVPQSSYGYLAPPAPNPFCERYRTQLKIQDVISEAGRSCGSKLNCLCGNCCNPHPKLPHQDHHPMLRLFLHFLSQKNFSHAKKDVVLRMLLEQKFSKLVEKITNTKKQEKMFQDTQAVLRQEQPQNFPLLA